MPEPTKDEETSQANLPKGVVLDKDGKPYVSNAPSVKADNQNTKCIF